MKLFTAFLVILLFLNCSTAKKQIQERNIYEVILNEEFPISNNRELIINYSLIEDEKVKKNICKDIIKETSQEDFELLCSSYSQEKFSTIEFIKLTRDYLIFNEENISKFNSDDYENMPYGVIFLSNIFSTNNSNIKVIYIEKYFSGWDGFGKVYLVQEENGHWFIKNKYTLWKS